MDVDFNKRLLQFRFILTTIAFKLLKTDLAFYTSFLLSVKIVVSNSIKNEWQYCIFILLFHFMSVKSFFFIENISLDFEKRKTCLLLKQETLQIQITHYKNNATSPCDARDRFKKKENSILKIFILTLLYFAFLLPF